MAQAIVSSDIDLPYKKVFAVLMVCGFLNLVYCVPQLFLMIMNMLRNESMHERNAINEYLRTGNRRNPIITEGRLLDECWLTEIKGRWEVVDNIDFRNFHEQPKKDERKSFFSKFFKKKQKSESKENTDCNTQKVKLSPQLSSLVPYEIMDPNQKPNTGYDPINNPKMVYVKSRIPIRDRARINPYNLGWLENCKQLLGNSVWQWFTIDVTCKGTGMEYPKNTAEMVDDLEAFL